MDYFSQENEDLNGRGRAQAAGARPEPPAPKTASIAKRLDVTIPAGTNPSAVLQTVLGSDIEFIESVALVLSNEAVNADVELDLTIGGNELIDKNTSARLLFCYASVPANDRFLKVNCPAGNGKVRSNFSYVGTLASPLKVQLYLQCRVRLAS